jgi:hypothetical protein
MIQRRRWKHLLAGGRQGARRHRYRTVGDAQRPDQRGYLWIGNDATEGLPAKVVDSTHSTSRTGPRAAQPPTWRRGLLPRATATSETMTAPAARRATAVAGRGEETGGGPAPQAPLRRQVITAQCPRTIGARDGVSPERPAQSTDRGGARPAHRRRAGRRSGHDEGGRGAGGATATIDAYAGGRYTLPLQASERSSSSAST